MRKLEFIDALRGIAIFLVLIIHCGNPILKDFPHLISLVIDQGARGVQLFYIVSALTLFLSLTIREKKEINLYKNFFIRRFFRIAPLFYCAVIFYLIILGFGPRYWLGDVKSVTIPNIMAHLLFLNGWNPYWINSIIGAEWSIAIEMFFYLLLPLFFIKVKSLNKSIILAFIVLLSSNLLQLVMKMHPFIADEKLWKNYLFLWLPNQLPVFCLGIIVFFILSNNSQFDCNISHIKNKKNIIKLSVLALSYIIIPIVFGNLKQQYIFIFGLAFSILTVFLAVKPVKLFINKFWCLLGKLSFSIYLIHLYVVGYPASYIMNFIISCFPIANIPIIHLLLMLSITLILCIVISYFTLKLIEEPFQIIGKKIITKLELEKNKVLLEKQNSNHTDVSEVYK